ncbi:MAG TPA: DUF1257 domain-containing protein [Candidatus Limnocylindrales bacterium]|nr:DUF1257 domain-containing protein [Candidatus Limnocylindrales bacterium]
MSHYTRVRTVLKDPEILVLALTDVGFAKIERHAQAQALVGYQGDRRAQMAEIIVRRKHIGRLSNDIGFARRGDGTFEAIISDFDRRKYGRPWLDRLAHAYGRRATLRFAAEHGYSVEEQVERGQTRILLRRSGA